MAVIDAPRDPHAGPRKIRVRTNRRGYATPFRIELGQRNAVLIQRPLTPLKRLFHWGMAVAIPYDWNYDLVHSYNAVPVVGGKPFIVSFEDYMPRTPDDVRFGWREWYVGPLERSLRRRLLASRCVALLAGSEYARRQFLHQHRDFDQLPDLVAKLRVLYPVTRLRRRDPKPMSDALRVAFVGTDFLRKGGPIVLRAHEKLRRAGVPVRTTVVSILRRRDRFGCYVAPLSGSLLQSESARLRQAGVAYHPGLPNKAVIELMEQSDYTLVPTFHDNFPLNCLEALSCGTPVIATDTCALPEMVEHGRSGYLLPFENERHVGKWVWLYRRREPGYADAYMHQVEVGADALADRLAACWEARKDYEALSAGALARIASRFNADRARRRLEELYESCRPEAGSCAAAEVLAKMA